MYSIGQVAKQSNMSVETIRYYEKEGLIEVPERLHNGYRSYKEETMHRLAFIQQAKELGFSLREIGELLSIKSAENMICDDVKQLAQEKLKNIDSKISLLRRMKKSLEKLVDVCPGQAPVSDCPILDALQKKAG